MINKISNKINNKLSKVCGMAFKFRHYAYIPFIIYIKINIF